MSGSMRRMRRARLAALTGAVAMLMALLPATAASAAPSQAACDSRNNNQYSKLLECVRLDEVREHQAAFQAIADANGGTRAAGTPGYDASVDYVVDTLEAAGWNVTLARVPVHLLPAADAAAADPGQRHLRDRRLHRQRFRHGDRECHPGGHQPGAAAGVDQRV